MNRMWVLFRYALIIILFFFFSELLINLNLETNYDSIGRKDNLKQVNVYQAEATKINGRIKGTIYNEDDKIDNKYLKIDLYSDNNNLLGSRYIDIESLRENKTKQFEIYFKVYNVEYYELSFVDEKDEEGELPIILQDLSKSQIFWGTLFAILILY